MKKLLLIAPKFYNYHEIIKSGFEAEGYEVDYFDDRPSTDFFTKVLVRLNKKLINGKIKKYFNSILEQAKKKSYDFVFVLYGQAFKPKMMKELREVLPNARFVFYMYDPICCMPDRVEFSKYFDKCFSFDYNDTVKYENFKLLPLFYSFTEFEKKEIKHDACCLTTMMPGKYSKVKAIIEQMQAHGFSIYKFFFLQSKLVWLYYKLTKKEFRKSKMREFSYSRMTNAEANKLLEESKYIVDCPKEGQSGLTIRTFECLAANKKLITTNDTICNYDFYRPENIYVFKDKIDFDDVFFHSDYVEIPNEIKQKYSIESFIKTILRKDE